MSREIWRFFGQKKDIKDIKRDIFGNRMGLIKVDNMETVRRLIERFNNNIFLGYRVHLKFTKERYEKEDAKKVMKENDKREKMVSNTNILEQEQQPKNCKG